MLESTDYKDWGILIRLIGWGFLLAGICAALIGPVEIYCFYLFSAGGRFHYEGFGFGSLMFGNITIQIAGYYLIALVCIPLGYGHIKSYDWSRKITLTLLWDWLILSLPLSIVILLMLITSKGIPPNSLPFVGLVLILLYPILPLFIIRFYRSEDVQRTFHHRRSGADWIGRTPQPVLVVVSLMILFILALHVPILFNGAFPLFGSFLYELDGILLLDLSILSLAWLTWGLSQRRKWAWWGTMVYWGLMTLSSVTSFLATDPHDIYAEMKFASLEMDALQGVPVQGAHLAFLIALPAILTLVALALAGRHMEAKARA